MSKLQRYLSQHTGEIMEQERLAPQRVIGRIKLTEPKCSWQQLGRKGPGSGCDKGREWPRFGVIKKTGVFLCAPKAIYKTERRICHVLDARVAMWNSTSFTVCLLLGSKQTKRTCSSFVTYAASPWRVGNQSREERRGEGKVRNVFKYKDHKFNTFHCASGEAGGRS